MCRQICCQRTRFGKSAFFYTVKGYNVNRIQLIQSVVCVVSHISYAMNTIEKDNGLYILLFVTVLQKEKELYECQEYQTIDKTIDQNIGFWIPVFLSDPDLVCISNLKY